MRLILLAAIPWSALLLACPGAASVQCVEDGNCNRFAGGLCRVAPSGQQWCSYPDPACPSGYRYSDLDVGDGLSGRCVMAPDPGEPDAEEDPPRCGDRILTAPEQCDDGNTASGDGCSATCHLEICGNGIIDPGESCDDGNTTCGTCSADCRVFASAKATGGIGVVAANSIASGESFMLTDGISPALRFEFTKTGTGTPPNILVNIGSFDDEYEVCNAVISAINLSGLRVVAGRSTTDFLYITNTQRTSVGNIPITESVADPGFFVEGMSRGAGGDCVTGQNCQTDLDCRSNVCQQYVCE